MSHLVRVLGYRVDRRVGINKVRVRERESEGEAHAHAHAHLHVHAREHVHVDGEKRTNIIRTEGQLPAHLTVALTVAKSSSAPIMAVIADTSRLWLIVVHKSFGLLQAEVGGGGRGGAKARRFGTSLHQA